MSRWRYAVLVTCVASVVALAGCSTSQDDEVRRTAEQLGQAVGASDWEAACEQLAPGTRHEMAQSGGTCAKGLSAEKTGGWWPHRGRRGLRHHGAGPSRG